MEMRDRRIDFLISDRVTMVENLNRISDDLLKSYWHFLATIAILGLAYKYALIDFKWSKYQDILIVLICLVGNIIFWLIGEYALSHGFLFRYIQAKVAAVEKIFYRENTGMVAHMVGLINDPTRADNFILDNHFEMDHFIPDQFVPIYWASCWLIIINSVSGLVLSNWYIYEKLFVFGIISLPLIWKLWSYYAYKIGQFIERYVNLGLTLSIRPAPEFFRFPRWPSFMGLALGLCLGLLVNIIYKVENVYWYVAASGMVGYYSLVFIGLLLQLVRYILRWLKGQPERPENRFYRLINEFFFFDVRKKIPELQREVFLLYIVV